MRARIVQFLRLIAQGRDALSARLLSIASCLDRTVSWKGKKDVSKLIGKPIRMRFVMREADLYSFKFERDS